MDIVNQRQPDGIFPPRAEQPVSAAPLADAEIPSAPTAVENPTTQGVVVQTPDTTSLSPQAPKIDLGSPVEVGIPTSSEQAELPEQSTINQSPASEISPSVAVEGSFATGAHDTLEEAVAQSPINEKASNIGDVGVADEIQSVELAQPVIEQSSVPTQPPEMSANVSGTKPTGEVQYEAVPPPFVITPEEPTPEPAPTVLRTEVAPPLDPVTPIDKATAPVTPAVPVDADAGHTALSLNATESRTHITSEKLAEIREDLLAVIDQILKEDRSKLRAAVEERLNKAA
jgi:hypothetical protein